MDAKTVQNLQEWKRLENKVDNEDRNVKNDVNLLKKQAKDLEYGHQRLKGLMTNQRQKTQVMNRFLQLDGQHLQKGHLMINQPANYFFGGNFVTQNHL